MKEAPVTLVTGARKGLGQSLVDHFLARGHRVVGVSRKAPDWGAAGFEHHQVDVSDEAAVCALFSSIRHGHGRLDNLVNNAGVAAMNHSLLTPFDTVRRILDTNVAGTFLMSREAARLMRRSGRGRIVNMVSVAVPLQLEGESIYAASKAAVVSLTQILAKEFSPLGITVNAVGPGPIRTDLIRGVAEEKLQRLLQRQAIQRFGEPKDVSNVIDFFLSEASDFVTGQVIYLGGVS